jgi:hypothetical protein
LRAKKSTQLKSEKGRAIRTRIEIEKQPAVLVQETRPNVIDKKFPIGGRPFNTIADAPDPVKTNPVRRDQIEFPAEIGEGSLSFDPADDPRNLEQSSRGAEERLSIGIEAENVVAEKFADVKKVAGAAAKIENAQWRRAIEPKVSGALDVDLDPVNNVFETVDSR